mgnify:CR=1 FL=1
MAMLQKYPENFAHKVELVCFYSETTCLISQCLSQAVKLLIDQISFIKPSSDSSITITSNQLGLEFGKQEHSIG